ncbi:uncharacterized protein LOC126661966 [Mercurialis annua]|uniref:uncharacterized protein LOC126661966 n=1 Tax=Mercurialis annua TaxID=3986 RepID=UPI0024AF2DA0|nr:uncharacterized protein LOC126661966 [Mercurialis annua]
MELSNSHLDVLFYYLRKKGKYDKSLALKFTTTDSLFDQSFQSFASIFMEGEFDTDLLLGDDMIGEYIKGNHMYANTAWKDCESMFIPVHVKENSHWILLALNLRFRRLTVMNSLRTPSSVNAARVIAIYYATVLPYFLDMLDVFKLNSVCDMSSPFYISQGSTDALDVLFDDCLPLQVYKDCGFFVYSFAEYVAYGKEDDMVNEYCINDHRRRLAFGLYNYGNWKNNFNIESSSNRCEVNRKGKAKAKHVSKHVKAKPKGEMKN